MITIRELLNRIRWDREFGRGEFAIGYFDRVQGRIVVVLLNGACFDPGDTFSVQVIDGEGERVGIPLHRVCELYRDGELIWRRQRYHPRGEGG